MAFKQYIQGQKIKRLKDMLWFATSYNNIALPSYRTVSVITPYITGVNNFKNSFTDVTSYNELDLYNALNIFTQLLTGIRTKGIPMRFYDVKTNDTQPNDYITNILFEKYGERFIDRKFFEYINWTGVSTDYMAVHDEYMKNITINATKNSLKYAQMLRALLENFNPLWNVDGTEETIRTLEQDGTVTNAKRGGDSTQETTTGTDSKTGTVADAKTGNDSRHITGTDTDANSGVDTSTRSRTTTEGTTFYDAEKETVNNGKTVTTTHNTTDATTYNNTNTTTHNTTDTVARNVNTGVTYNSDDTTTKDLLDTERITLTRRGNIGVISTVKLLQEFREFYNVDLFSAIAKDIAYDLTEGVY